MKFINPTAPRRPGGAATALLWYVLATAATSASGAAPFTCPGGATCKNWNDGCNDCGVGDDGTEACTEMYCVCIEDGSCPAPRCLDVEGCKPIEGDPKQISIGGNLKPEDGFIVCATVWEPVCGSDGRVYSNPCEARSKGQEVEYEFSPDASVTAGDDCPPKKEDPAQISIGGNLKPEDDGTVCSRIWQPVCGSDDKVYSNDCTAGAAGQEVEYEFSPNDAVSAGDDCPPGKGDPAQISIGGNLKDEEASIACIAIWQPVCGSDGRVYSNACEAEAARQKVEYEFSPNDNVTPGKDCPSEKPSVTVTMGSCGSMKGCVDCIGGGCTWAAGECMEGCLVADVPCYSPGGLQYAGSSPQGRGDETPAEVCQLEADAKADNAACNLKSCGECVATALPSDKTKTCRWFGSNGGFCGSACGLAGCGETECPLQGEGEEDISVCTKEFKPVCGSDDKVYSNACEAEAAGQRVQYEIKAPGDAKSVGQDCPPEDEKPAISMESCGPTSTCVDCLELGCAWTADECMMGCLVADAPCYTTEGDQTPAQVCLEETEAKADAAACNVKSCEECVSTALPSDKTKTCMWFDGGSCGSECGMAGCGETECPQEEEGGEDITICTKEWKPVCGSDDKVYSNACTAEAEGQKVQYEIESPDSVTAGKDCPPESVDPQGGSDEDIIVCTKEWAPVCGSDDKVYSNACTAEAEGQKVQYEIESPDSVTAGKDCPPESVDPQGGGDEDLIPCDAEWAPVCGSDDKVYSNACEAEAAGQEVQYEIESPDSVTAGKDCPPESPTEAVPEEEEDGIVCTEEWKPVCGSDDKVYGNACEAEAEGQEVQYEIESPDDSVTAGKDCPPESPTEAVPEEEEDIIVCTEEWAPVCGSDDKVYGNACEAGAAGQEVQYEIESPDDSVTAGKDCPPESPAEALPEEEEDPLEDEDDSAGDRVMTWHHGLLLVLHLAAAMMV